MIKRALYLLLFAVLLLQTAAAQNDTIVFMPQWTAQAQFAGYYVAEAKGFYREAGVKVRIEHPSSTQSAMTRLRKNLCQATTLQVCQALEFVDEGIPLVNILQTSMNNAMVIVSYRDLQRHPENADSMFVYSCSILLNNPDFYNCSIAFEPDYFKDRGRC